MSLEVGAIIAAVITNKANFPYIQNSNLLENIGSTVTANNSNKNEQQFRLLQQYQHAWLHPIVFY